MSSLFIETSLEKRTQSTKTVSHSCVGIIYGENSLGSYWAKISSTGFL